MEESFSIRWDEDEDASEDVIIAVPIRPQPNTLRIIGAVLVIGGLLALFSGASNLLTGMDDGPTDPAMYEPVALQLQSAGEDVTSQEIAAYYDAIAEKGYYEVLGTLETCAGLLLIVSGVLLFRRHSYGIRIGVTGGSLLLLDAVAGLYFLRSVEAPICYAILDTQYPSNSSHYLWSVLYCVAFTSVIFVRRARGFRSEFEPITSTDSRRVRIIHSGFGHFFESTLRRSSFIFASHQFARRQIAYRPRTPRKSAPSNLAS